MGRRRTVGPGRGYSAVGGKLLQDVLGFYPNMSCLREGGREGDSATLTSQLLYFTAPPPLTAAWR